MLLVTLPMLLSLLMLFMLLFVSVFGLCCGCVVVCAVVDISVVFVVACVCMRFFVRFPSPLALLLLVVLFDCCRYCATLLMLLRCMRIS